MSKKSFAEKGWDLENYSDQSLLLGLFPVCLVHQVCPVRKEKGCVRIFPKILNLVLTRSLQILDSWGHHTVSSQCFEEHLMGGKWTHRWTTRSIQAWAPRGSGRPWRSWGSLCSRITLLRDLELQPTMLAWTSPHQPRQTRQALRTRQRSAEEDVQRRGLAGQQGRRFNAGP